MRTLIALIMTLVTGAGLVAQETLFSDLSVLGAFGGPFVEISEVNGQTVAVVGGGGALVLDNFYLGGYGQGGEYAEATVGEGMELERYDVKFGHGGLWLGYSSNPYKLVHFFSSFKIGWGRARLRQSGDTAFQDRIFALTPEVGLEINLTDFFKLAFTGGYRYVDGIDRLPGLSDSDFRSPVGTITFRFGGFGDDVDWDWD